MSGIAGLLRKDGLEAGPEELAGMAHSLQHRGPDGTRIWRKDSIGFVHCALWTTPESMGERLPHCDSASGMAITADARIDNRAGLIESLGLREADQEIGDTDLIRLAYEAWGSDCPAKLVGDFAFVIWDERRRQIFAARDPMGVKALYYFDSPKLFAFASEIKALVSLPEVPRELDEVRVAEFLVNFFDDREITFYKGVRRLPSATALIVSDAGSRLSPYWSLDPKREIRLRNDAEYAEAFREQFAEAVRTRVRCAFPIASTLSGGLDSSAIACVAGKLVNAKGEGLHTLSAIFPGAPQSELEAIDERPYIRAALSTGTFLPHYVRADQMSPMRQYERVHLHLDEANFAPNLYMHWAMYEEAAHHGVRVLLDGFDGDITVSHGLSRFPELFYSLQWRTLADELRMVQRNLLPFSSFGRIFWNLCIKPSAPAWLFRAKRLLQGRFRELGGNPTLIEPGFAQAVRIEERVKKLAGPAHRRPRNSREEHLQGILDGTYASALETADKSSAAFGIEARYPFFDRRLIEFCLALPAEQKFGHGWNRLVFRRSMEGILPPEIQWRPKKGNLSCNFYLKFLERERETLEQVVYAREPGSFARFVDRGAMHAAYRRFAAAPLRNNQQAVQLFTAVSLALWLRQTALQKS